MFKFVVGLAFIGLICGNPLPQEESGQTATAYSGTGGNNNGASGNNWPQWPQFPQIRLPQMNFPQIPNYSQVQGQWPQASQYVAGSRPGNGGHFSGAASSISSQTEWKDGKPVTVTKGGYIADNDGKIISGTIPSNNADNN